MITVLLIDDEPAILDVTRLFLERTGAFSVGTTSSGAEALEKIDSQTYDVIISDYEMPGMNGIELLEALRFRGVDVPFIIFTGKGREVVAVEALTYGATYYQQKGGEPREQFEKIAKALFLIAQQISALTLKNLQQSQMIAERMKAEADLNESRKHLQSLIDFLPEAMLLHDLEGRMITVNKKSVEMSGSSSEEEMIGVDALSFFAPADRDRVREDQRKTLTEGAFPITEYQFLKKDGTTIPAEFTFSLLRDRNGSPISFIGLGHDITERKKGEKAVRMANKKLNLLSSVTRHDVLNQLTALRGFLELAEEAPDAQARSQLIEKVVEAAERIHHQINFTGDYQKIGLGSPQWQDLDTTIRRAASTLDLQGITLSIEVEGCSLYADPLLEKVFFNLMENAKRYATGLSRIRFSIEEQGADRAVVCTDNGPGIPSSEKESIFLAGYGKNTGYGLFLINEILSITGLSIVETGTPGAGARFEIRAPADQFRCA